MQAFLGRTWLLPFGWFLTTRRLFDANSEKGLHPVGARTWRNHR